MDIGSTLTIVALALAWFLFQLEVSRSRRRDLVVARSDLLAVRHGMLDSKSGAGWGAQFFKSLSEDEVAERASYARDRILNGRLDQVYTVPTAPLEAVLNSPVAGDLIDVDTVEAASTGLYWTQAFNSLAQQQISFNAQVLPDVRDELLPDERRQAIALAAETISYMLTFTAGRAAEGTRDWFSELRAAIDENLASLDQSLRRPSVGVLAAGLVLIGTATVAIVAHSL